MRVSSSAFKTPRTGFYYVAQINVMHTNNDPRVKPLYVGCYLQCQQCTAMSNRKGKTKGARCNRTACMGLTHCWFHLATEKKLKIANSQIKAAGQGLYAHDPRARSGSVIFAKGEVIAPYIGESATLAEMESIYPDGFHPYTLCEHTRCVDAACKRGAAAFANHLSSGTTRIGGKTLSPNAEFSQDMQRSTRNQIAFNVVATRDVVNNEEIFVNYHDEYDPTDPDELRHSTVRVSNKRKRRLA